MSAATQSVSEGERLYAAWRVVRAKWEIARYEPANLGRDLSEEMDASFCEADHAALTAYLLHPARDLRALARKLRTFRQEEGTCFSCAAEIVEMLENDAYDLAFAHSSRAHRQ